MLVAFLNYETDIQDFGEKVIAEVRRKEKEGRGKDQAFEIGLTGDVYKQKNQAEGANATKA